jgi:hypothetical protein
MPLAAVYQLDTQVEMSGDQRSLIQFADSLMTPTAFEVPLVEVPLGPWDGQLRRLVVSVESGPLTVGHDGQTLTIAGGAEHLAVLRGNIRSFAKKADIADSDDHIHLEHMRDVDDYYIEKDALPLIVRICDPK